MEEIEAAIETYARPLIEADGGTIEILSFEADTLRVRLGGSYGGCPGVPEVCAGVIEPVASKAVGKPVTVQLVRSPRPRNKPEE